jgi:hypothetical protein
MPASLQILKFFPKWTKKIVIQRGETDLPVTIIADPAYPLKPWIMKSYSVRGNLTATQARFFIG